MMLSSPRKKKEKNGRSRIAKPLPSVRRSSEIEIELREREGVEGEEDGDFSWRWFYCCWRHGRGNVVVGSLV